MNDGKTVDFAINMAGNMSNVTLRHSLGRVPDFVRLNGEVLEEGVNYDATATDITMRALRKGQHKFQLLCRNAATVERHRLKNMTVEDHIEEAIRDLEI